MPSQMIWHDEKLVFEISGEDCHRLRKWIYETGSRLAKSVLDSRSDSDEPISSPLEQFMLWAADNPEERATDRGLELLAMGFLYEFEPNSLGLRVGVRHITTGEALDLSHYEEW